MPLQSSQKKECRIRAKKARNSAFEQSVQQKALWGEPQLNRLAELLPPLPKARLILGTLPIASELRLMPFSEFGSKIEPELRLQLIQERWIFPKVNQQSPSQLLWFEWKAGNDIQELKALPPYGIPEASVGKPIEYFLENTTNVAVLTPALAINSEGFRLGYGGGFYDRFLEHLLQLQSSTLQICTLGAVNEGLLDFDFPVESHDVPVDVAITESETRFFTSKDQVLSKLGM